MLFKQPIKKEGNIMNKAKVKQIKVSLVCPNCDELQVICTHAPNYIHQGSHKRMCENCYEDYYWSFQAQTSMIGMPEYIKPIRSY